MTQPPRHYQNDPYRTGQPQGVPPTGRHPGSYPTTPPNPPVQWEVVTPALGQPTPGPNPYNAIPNRSPQPFAPPQGPSTGVRPALLVTIGVAVLAVLGSLLTVLLVVGGSDDSPSPTASGIAAEQSGVAGPATFTTDGSITLFDDGGYSIASIGDGSCTGDGGYSDIGPGVQVVVNDASGTTLVVGELAAGSGDSYTCAFDFVLEDIPEGEKFYSVEISHRGSMKYSESDMKEGLALQMGQ